MNLLYPNVRLSWLPAMFGTACIGALIAGLYGIAHDQITYSISPEYFTRMKFNQFHWADLGLSPRLFVAEIGFLATWWVGFVGGWFLTRVALPACPPRAAFRLSLRGFFIMIGCASTATITGYLYGITQDPRPNNSGLADFAASIGIADVRDFVRVAYIHNASYLGGLIGLIAALIYVRRRRSTDGPPPEMRDSNH
jgi:hypothetical protein